MDFKNITPVTDENFNELVIQSTIPVMVFFWAEWSGISRQMVPIVENLVPEYSGKASIVSANVDDDLDIAGYYNVTDVPDFMIFKNGVVCKNLLNLQPQKVLEAALDECISQ